MLMATAVIAFLVTAVCALTGNIPLMLLFAVVGVASMVEGLVVMSKGNR